MVAKEQHPRLNSGLHTHTQACVPACMYVCVYTHTKTKRRKSGGKKGKKNKTLNRHFTEGKRNFKFKLQ